MIPGLSSLGEALQGLISKNFAVAGFLPTVLFVLASFWPISVVMPDTWLTVAAQLEDLETIGSLLSFQLLTLIVASYVVWSFRTFFRELIEGRYLWSRARDRLIAFQIAHHRKLNEKRDALRRDRYSLRQVAKMDVFEARNIDPETDDPAIVELSREQWANKLQVAFDAVQGENSVKADGGNDLESLNDLLVTLKSKQEKQEKISFDSLKNCYEKVVSHCQPGEYAELSSDGEKHLTEAASELPHLAQYALAKVEDEHSRLSSQLAYKFPNHHLDIGPTALANMAEIQRSYAEVRYGINIDLIRPRLQKLIDEDSSFSSLLDATQTHVDANVVMTVLTVLYGLVWFVPMAIGSDTPADFMIVVSASAVVATLFYSMAVRAARRNGEVLRSAVDLFRFDLLDLMHIGKPDNSDEEKVLWSRVMGHIAVGKGYKIDYDHGDDSGLDALADQAVVLDDDGESQIEALLADIRERVRGIFR